MAIADTTPAMKAVVSLAISQADQSQKRANPFASAKDAATSAASLDQSPFATVDVQEAALAIRTSSSEQQKPAKKVSFSKKLFSCACVRPEVSGDEFEVAFSASNTQSLSTSSNTSSMSDAPNRKKGVQWDISPKKSLMKQSSCAYTDVDW
jgi:hypothetical protein